MLQEGSASNRLLSSSSDPASASERETELLRGIAIDVKVETKKPDPDAKHQDDIFKYYNHFKQYTDQAIDDVLFQYQYYMT